MNNRKKSKQNIVWLLALMLFACVAATTFAFANILNSFWPDDSGAISLIYAQAAGVEAESTAGTDETTAAPSFTETEGETFPETEGEGEIGETAAPPVTEEQDAETVPPVAEAPGNPGLEVEDGQTVWTTNTQVEIFKISYENGESVITVQSDDGSKIIAPGTENSYTFKLKNTGNAALDYAVDVDAYCSPAEISIPITGRISRYDGTWIVGGQDSYAEISALDMASDSDTLGAGRYTCYTLDWVWPFEGGDDELDTLLGNMAAEQDVTFTIVIKTTAAESENPDGGGGIITPDTGDSADFTLWIVLAICSLAVIIFLVLYQNREKRRGDAEEEKN